MSDLFDLKVDTYLSSFAKVLTPKIPEKSTLYEIDKKFLVSHTEPENLIEKFQ